MHVWHIGSSAFGAGLSLGGAYHRQDWGDGSARSRDGLVHVGALALASVELAGGFYSGINVDGMAYFYPAAPHGIAPPSGSMTGPNHQNGVTGPGGTAEVTRASTPFALRFNLLLLGKRW
jgi:hypothetical protein